MEETVDGKDNEVTDCDNVDLVSEMKADELDMDRSLLDAVSYTHLTLPTNREV